MLLKNITTDLSVWKDIPCSWIGKTLKVTYKFNVISIKILMTFLYSNERSDI